MGAPDGTHPKLFQTLQMCDVLNDPDLVVSHVQGGEPDLIAVHAYVKMTTGPHIRTSETLDAHSFLSPRSSLGRYG